MFIVELSLILRNLRLSFLINALLPRLAVIAVYLTIFGFPTHSLAKTSSQPVWYKNGVIYTLDVDSFQDSDGDGIGDFKGLTQRLPYLQSLGVTTIWLSPFHPTPNRDDGYDVSDYYNIDPHLGTMADFRHFISTAKQYKMHIIMDLVINHTSDQHPWFLAAQDPKSPYNDWYVWSKTRPKEWNKGMVFPGVQTETWTRSSKTGQYYFHRFYNFQPDLNFQNPEVVRESERIIRYWLKLGISGFRLDGAPFVIEIPNTSANHPKHDINLLYHLRHVVTEENPEAVLLGEANVLPNETEEYFGKHGEGMQMIFNFYANQYFFLALATGDVKKLMRALQKTQKIPEGAQWAFFLRNHDEVDLGRLTPKERARVYQKFGPQTSMQLYGRGIRRRLMPMIDYDRRRFELANSFLFAFPGTPVIRYGDEIGMGDDLNLKERLSVRTPMQWDHSINAGFTTASQTFRPVISSGAYGYRNVNASDQALDPDSMLNWTQKMVALRMRCPEISLGKMKVLPVGSSYVIALSYFYQGKEVVTVHNFSDQSQTIKLSLEHADLLTDLIHFDDIGISADGSFVLTLKPFGYSWFRANQN